MVWRTIRNFEGADRWRSNVERVDRRLDAAGAIVWVETDPGGDSIAYATEEEVPDVRLVRRIISKDLPFGGKWTLTLSDDEGGCKLTVTEDGEVYNPFFRFFSRYVFGHYSTIDRYLSDLRRHVETR